MFEVNPSIFLKAPNFWTFWKFLLVQLHCSASLLHLAIFIKNQQIFRKTPLFFLNKKPKFFTFWEILLFQLHSTANLLPLAVFKKLKIFLEKPIFFSKGSQVSNVLRYLTNSVAFYSKFATFGNFVRKSQFLFEKHNNLFNKTNFWMFWEILFFSGLVVQLWYF